MSYFEVTYAKTFRVKSVPVTTARRVLGLRMEGTAFRCGG